MWLPYKSTRVNISLELHTLYISFTEKLNEEIEKICNVKLLSMTSSSEQHKLNLKQFERRPVQMYRNGHKSRLSAEAGPAVRLPQDEKVGSTPKRPLFRLFFRCIVKNLSTSCHTICARNELRPGKKLLCAAPPAPPA